MSARNSRDGRRRSPAREAAAAAASEKIDHRMTELDALQQRITSLEAVHRSRKRSGVVGTGQSI